MDLEEFLNKRKKELQWRIINGYINDDPTTNGEFKLIEFFIKHCQLFIDVGANVGDFIGKARDFNDELKVLAYEANIKLEPIIKEKIGTKGEIFTVALSNKPGKQKFFIHPDDSTVSSFFKRMEMMPKFREKMKPLEVEVKTLNNYIEKINQFLNDDSKAIFIKIDVEGSEFSVLMGASEVLKLTNPIIILFEYSFGWKESNLKLKDAFHFLDNLEFQIYRLTPLGLENIRFFTLDMEDYTYCNYVAIKNLDLDQIATPVEITSVRLRSNFYPFSHFKK